jgi:RNA polymerase sigma-70 factor, ECF subfamily
MAASDAARETTIDSSLRQSRFLELYDASMGEVYRFVHRRCRDRALAEDITQDTYLAAARAFEDPSDVTVGWLIQVARHRLIDHLRRQERFAGRIHLVPRRIDGDDADATIDRLRITEALERIPTEHRVVLALHYIDGWSIAAIASELGRSSKSVEAVVTRARRRLRLELERTDG